MKQWAYPFPAVLAGLALVACGGGERQGALPAPEPPAAETARAAAPEPAAAPPCRPGAYEALRTGALAYAAVVRSSAQAYRAPGGKRLARFGARNVNGVPTVFGVLGKRVEAGCAASWYRVQLPMKPNGIVGWVRAADVELHPVATRIVVSLSGRRVTLFRDGRRLIEARATIGSAATPTPEGEYYVNQRLVPTDPTGPFGPGAIGISAFSEVLTGWAQGGPVAIHGTNRPDLIGHAVSNGCIRVRNDVLERMFELALPGTPVVVH